MYHAGRRIAIRGYATAACQNYSASLLLPKTEFPQRPDHSVSHVAKLQEQNTQILYDWQRHRSDLMVEEEYIIHDGPPYANGDLHMGHAMNKILKDVILRKKILEGRRVRFVPGWDCHGLPIELKALQAQADSGLEESATSKDKQPVNIRTLAKSLAERTIMSQSTQFQMMAVCADWASPYLTLNSSFEIDQLEIFGQMVESGLIYRADKPVFWSPSTKTALAEAELEYNDNHVSHSAYVSFPLSFESCLSLKNLSWTAQGSIELLIWTTTPWTIPANKAIAVNAKLKYSLITVIPSIEFGTKIVPFPGFKEKSYIVATSLIEKMANFLIDRDDVTIRVHDTVLLGRNLVGLTYVDPLQDNSSSSSDSTREILCADYVSAESGTGLVHTAPGHGQEDYALCRSLSTPIPPFSPVDDAGCYTLDLPQQYRSLVGLSVQDEGNRQVIQMLKTAGKLIQEEDYKHKYPYDWRSKKPIIVRSTPQFFADLSPIKTKALEELDKVHMIPSAARARLRSFVEGRDDWCISRQRSWGVPIPALHDQDGNVLMNRESISHILTVLKQKGTDAWFEADKTKDDWKIWVLPSKLTEAEANGRVWTRGKETLDVWFDSGCSWATLQREMDCSTVADLYLEGTDQHRGWFQSSLLTSVATRHVAPYKTVLTHGFVLDEKRRKMSKSLGNVMDPLLIITGRKAKDPVALSSSVLGKEISKKKRKRMEKQAKEDAKEIQALGVDVLRMWIAQSDYTGDVNVSTAILTHVSESLRKVRTTLRFLIGNLNGYVYKSGTRLHKIDVHAMDRSFQFREEAERHYESFAFNKVISLLNNHTNAFLSSFYFDTIKDRLYADCKSSNSRQAAQETLVRILKDYLLVLAPITPILVSEVWQYLPSSVKCAAPHIYATNWVHERPLRETEDLPLLDWSIVYQMRSRINQLLETARSNKQITASLQTNVEIQELYGHESGLTLLSTMNEDDLANIFIVSKVSVLRPGEPEKTHETVLAEGSFRIGTDPCSPSYRIRIVPAQDAKCPRCWTYTAPSTEELCKRCHKVIAP